MSTDENQSRTTRRKLLAASGSATLVGLAGCLGGGDDDPNGDDANGDDGNGVDENGDDANGNGDPVEESVVTLLVEGVDSGDDYNAEIEEFEIIDRSDDEVTAYVDVDHWHGTLPAVPEGDNISLGANIVDSDGDEVALDGDHHSFGVELADGAPEGVVSFDYHGDHVHIIGESEGMTEVVFQWLHDDHTEYETPTIPVEVVHDDGDHGDDDHDHGDDNGVEEFEIIDRSDDEVTAYVDGDHWHGDLPDVPEGDNISLGANIIDDHGDEVELDGDHHSLGVELADGAPEGVVSFDYHGDHVHIIGEDEGMTEVVFQWIHDDHVDYETPAIPVEVVHDHGDDDHDHDDEHGVEEFEIIDRSDDEVTAYVDGDHWHGSLPDVPEGDNISLGANIIDDHGDEVELDGDHHSLGVELADGAPEGVVSFDYHGDHVHIIGEDEGMTEVVFQWIHDDHVDYETPAIPVEVVHDHDDGDHDHDDDDHDVSEEGLSSHDISHACAHLEFDPREDVTGGETEDDAPVLSDTHQPFDVTYHGDSTYVVFEGDREMYAFFTESETASIEVLTGEVMYEGHDEDVCDYINAYVVVEPDHGQVVLSLSA